MDFNGKVAIITGSSRGIGKSCAKALLERGAKVCLSGVNVEKGKETLSEFKRTYGDNVIYVRCDVKNDVDMEALFKKTMESFKRVDIVVNNAAIADEKDWIATIDTNFAGVIRGTYLGMQYMRTDKGGNGGTIVNVSSLAAYEPMPQVPCYSGVKAGVVTFTRAWARHPETFNNGIRLACLSPGYTLTDMDNTSKEKMHDFKDSDLLFTEYTTMSADEVAEAFIKLLEDKDNHGKTLNVVGIENKKQIEYAKY